MNKLRKKQILLFSIIGTVILTAVLILVLCLVFTSKSHLAKLYNDKADILEKAGYGGQLIEQKNEIKSFCVENSYFIDGYKINAVLRLEGDILHGLEFDSINQAKKFYNSIKSDVKDILLHKNIVFISFSEYMSELLFGKIEKFNNEFIYIPPKSKTKILIKGDSPIISDVNIIGFRAYAFSTVKNISLGSSVIAIDNFAFMGCSNLESVEMIGASSLININKGAFYDCTKLNELQFPEVTEEIGERAFFNCSSLKFISFGGVKQIGDGAFFGTSSLTSIRVSDASNFFSDENSLYSSDSKTIYRYFGKQAEVMLPDSVEIIGNAAFERNAYIKKISQNTNNIKFIGDYAFESCRNLSSADIVAKTQKIGKNAFFNTKLNSVVFNDSLKHIEENAFRATSLVRVVLPKSIEQIKDKAFFDCSSLRFVHIQAEKPFYLGEEVFNNIFRLFVNEAKLFCDSWENYSNNIYDIKNISGDFAYVEINDAVEIIQYLGTKNNILIPTKINGKNVISIGSHAFAKLHFIESVSFESGSKVKGIKNNSFEGLQKLTSLNLPLGLTDIGIDAIRNNLNLVDLHIPSSVTFIERYAFDSTKWLAQQNDFVVVGDSILYKYKGNLAKVTLPDGIKQIGDRGFFNNANLETVILPNSLISLNNYSFAGCSLLKDINLPEGLKDIGASVFGGCVSLRSLTIPSSVWYIGYGTFYKLSLEKVIIEIAEPINIGGDLFAFPQNKNFEIIIKYNAYCSSKNGICNHEGGKTKCFRHANMWKAWDKFMKHGEVK